MERVIFVETLDRRGDVADRVRVTEFPFRIGRSYGGDLVLDDPHVHPVHAALEQDADGRIVWRERDERDGTPGAAREIPPRGELVTLLGQTQLRLRDRDFEVAPAIPFVPRGGLRGWAVSHWSAVPCLILGLIAVQLLITVGNTWVKIEPAALARQAALEASIILVWAGAWALVTRVLTHRARFVFHCAVTCAWALASGVSDEIYQWAQFLIPNIEPLRTGERISAGALGSLLLFAQLSIAHVARRRSRAWIAASIGFAAVTMSELLQRNAAEDWIGSIPFWSRIQPVDARWLPSVSADAFFAGTADLESALARDAKKDEPNEFSEAAR